MRKKIFCFVFFLLPFLVFGNGSLPVICDTYGNEYFLGMSPSIVRNILGEPSKIYEKQFLSEKPEFDEIYWEYDSGIIFSFYKGEKEIRRIVFWRNNYLVKQGKELFSPIQADIARLPDFFDEGITINNQDNFIVEFSYRKRNNYLFGTDILQFYFKDNLCFKVCLIDDSEFL